MFELILVKCFFIWDGNVTGMEEEARNHFYFQDDLGSPMRLADEAGRSEEIYGYDEFGNDIRTGQDIQTAHDIFKSPMQSFGFTGYQMDEAGGLYFAQARRYDAGAGRFTSEDFIKGHIAVPYTMNHYNYCWNRPMDLVDLNGMWPSLSDIGKGAEKLASSAADKVSKAADKVSDVAKDAAQGIKDTASNVKKSLDNLYEEHKEAIDTTIKVATTVLTVAAIGVVTAGFVTASMATGGAAGLAIIATVGASAGIAGVSGGLANVTTGGNFINGFVGGAINGAITAAGTCINPTSFFASNFIGGTVGTAITETLNAYDDPKNANSIPKIASMSLACGFTQGKLGKWGSKLGNKCLEGAGKLANRVWNGFMNLIGFSANEITYISAYEGYDGIQNLLTEDEK